MWEVGSTQNIKKNRATKKIMQVCGGSRISSPCGAELIYSVVKVKAWLNEEEAQLCHFVRHNDM